LRAAEAPGENPAVQSAADLRGLWGRWLALWNGDLAHADEIVHGQIAFHRHPEPMTAASGRAALVEWVTVTRALFDDLHFTTEVGPVVDGDFVAGRWIAEGGYRGGIPGATADPGTRVRFRGNDLWRAEDGLVREYWLSDDLLDLLQQVGAIPSR
jgi:predicted ester cyclase